MNLTQFNVRGSTQRALWGAVTGNLRAVTVTIIDNEIMLYFYYDKEPTENEVELSQIASTEVVSDFLVMIGEKQIVLPQPEPIPLMNGELVYHRYEGKPIPIVKTFFKDLTIFTAREVSERILIGVITNNVRAVLITSHENKLTLYFYYDKEPSNEEVIISESALQDLLACFEGVTGSVKRFVVPEPENKSFRDNGSSVYWRYEEYLIDD